MLVFLFVKKDNRCMEKRIEAFQTLADTFAKNGYKLYLVGGTVRDYLLGITLEDMDAVTDATPIEIVKFLPDVDTTFAHLGSLKYKDANGIKFDITTLREESGYLDSRHPSKVIFVKDPADDYRRRDFTVNAMYMDRDLKIYDFCGGQKDLQKRLLRMVGNPDQRLKEDPLRILRAIRFHLMYNFKIEDSLMEAMRDRFYLLKNITDAKIESEMSKIDLTKSTREAKEEIFSQFDIANLHGVVK